jgi:DNA-binding transcriptional ArsR family regulator
VRSVKNIKLPGDGGGNLEVGERGDIARRTRRFLGGYEKPCWDQVMPKVMFPCLSLPILRVLRAMSPLPLRVAALRLKIPCAVTRLRIYLQSFNCIMESRRDVFQGIADPTRRAILTLLAVQALTPGAIADNFKSSRQTISKHIQILTECELLKPEQNGREIYYHLNAKKMTEVADFIKPFRKLWDDRFNKLEIIMKSYKSKK